LESLPWKQQAVQQTLMSNINREALLRAAEAFSSSEGDSEHSSQHRGSRSPSAKRHKKEKRAKHSSSKHKHHKKHKRSHKRSEHEKIQEFERRAAAMGASSMLPRLPASLASLSAATAAGAGDVAVLDTVGDANNTMFESLYAGSVPRYNTLDPLNIVSSRARLTWQAQLQLPDTDVGNSRTDR
jgi:hypothetical protein